MLFVFLCFHNASFRFHMRFYVPCYPWRIRWYSSKYFVLYCIEFSAAGNTGIAGLVYAFFYTVNYVVLDG